MHNRLPIAARPRGTPRRIVDLRLRNELLERAKHTAEDRALLQLIEKLRRALRPAPRARDGDAAAG